MKFTQRARRAEEFDRVLRDGSADAAYARELSVVSALASHDVRPDPAFTTDLRASLLQAAREGAMADAEPTRVPRPARRRWTIAAPAVAVVLTTGGVAFAVTSLQTSNHTPSAAVPSSVASALSTAHAQLLDVSQELRAGHPTAASLTTLRAQAIQLQSLLVSAYGSGRDPEAIRELHQFAVSAIAQLAALHAEIPVGLTQLYLSTLQTLVNIATTAESTCPTCDLTPVQVPTSVAPFIHVPAATPPSVVPSGVATSAPAKVSSGPTVVPPTSVPPAPTATPSQPGLPTIPALPSAPVTLPAVPSLP